MIGYEELRTGCGAYRLARDVLLVHGPQAVEYLQGQCSQDVAALGVGQAADALLLAPDGKLDALVRVQRQAAEVMVLDTEGGYGPAVAERLQRFRLRTKVAIEPLAWSCVALRGAKVSAPGLPVSWGGAVGVDLLGEDPGAEVPSEATWCDDEAWEARRVEAGIPVMGRELDQRTIAAEAGLVERTVSFTKGCFTGQELVARLDARGNKVARRLCGVVAGPDAGLELRPGAELRSGDKVVGQVTSAAWCPGVGGPAALAYLHRSVDIGATVDVGGQPAEVRTLPLA